MAVTHIVLYRFKPGLSPETIAQACQRVIDLGQKCVHPATRQPYIKSFRGGRNNSPEGCEKGYTHAFVAEFETPEDRDYYVSRDPAHMQLNSETGWMVEDFVVIDFSAGDLV
ncbi:Dabb family protein [Aspergillus stella-maris]|uniref:Dabb family protein n=1 Tax=Aspergillus stella-maris TaxID=1810926 RepID=UPI003CCCE6DD